MRALFNKDDPVFKLRQALPESKRDFGNQKCNCCGERNKKLNYCEFCGKLTCDFHLSNNRPFLIDNSSHTRLSEKVCLTCNSKFMYRDFIFEMLRKLEYLDMSPAHDF